MENTRYHAVKDGGWGWLVLIGAFVNHVIYSGSVVNLGVYMVEWQISFSVGAGAVSIVATEMTVGSHFGGKFLSPPI